MTRTVLLRLFGLLVAAALGAVATSLLLSGLGLDWRGFEDQVRALASSVDRPVDPGWGVLAGVAILLSLAASGALVARPRRASLKRLERSATGTTSIDLTGLARVVRRRLRTEIDPQIEVAVRGRTIAATVPTGHGENAVMTVDRVAVALPEILDRLGADHIRHKVITGAATGRRVQ